jgi:N-acylneuraminate cytidylyltransferase
LDTFLQQQQDVVVTVREAERNPYFNMVRHEPDGLVRLAVEGNFHRRQDAPVVYDLTTVAYVARADFVLTANRLFDGKVRSVLIPRERALDIDTPLDMVVAQALAPHVMNVGSPRAL